MRYLLSLPALLLMLACASAPPPPSQESWSGHRLVLIGIDGATWDVIDPMMAGGELPNFRALVQRGARADLIAVPPLRSPVVWTTVATGRFPRDHFILDFTYPYVAGRKRAVESTQRRQPALWNIAGTNGKRVGVVGYYATSPAEIVNGFMVPDRILEGHGGITYPPELGTDLPLVQTIAERDALFDRFYPWDYDPQDENPAPEYRPVVEIVGKRVDWSILRDENVRRTSLELLQRPTDLFMAYFRIVDHTSHAAWLYYDDADFDTPADPFEKRLLGDLIPESYRFLDEYLGRVLETVGPEANILLMSDHGFGSATPPYEITDERLARLLSGSHRHNGIFLAAGPDIEPGRFEGVNVMDVAPLALAALGLPLSEQLPGRVPREILTRSFLERNPPRSIPAYDFEISTVADESPDPGVDEERLEQLKALGYIGRATRPGAVNVETELDFWEIEPRLQREALEGELLFHLMRGNTEAITTVMTLAQRRNPALFETVPARVGHSIQRLQHDFSYPIFDEVSVRLFRETYGAGSLSE